MSNALYPNGVDGFGDGSIDWVADDIAAILVSAAYVYDADHAVFADVTGILANAVSYLTGKTFNNRIADADDITLTYQAEGVGVAVIIYSVTADRLIAYIDNVAEGLPLTMDGHNVRLTWSNREDSKIFRL